jgi:hypothetical protein
MPLEQFLVQEISWLDRYSGVTESQTGSHLQTTLATLWTANQQSSQYHTSRRLKLLWILSDDFLERHA